MSLLNAVQSARGETSTTYSPGPSGSGSLLQAVQEARGEIGPPQPTPTPTKKTNFLEGITQKISDLFKKPTFTPTAPTPQIEISKIRQLPNGVKIDLVEPRVAMPSAQLKGPEKQPIVTPTPTETTWAAAPKPTVWNKIQNLLGSILGEGDADAIARAMNAYALQKVSGEKLYQTRIESIAKEMKTTPEKVDQNIQAQAKATGQSKYDFVGLGLTELARPGGSPFQQAPIEDITKELGIRTDLTNKEFVDLMLALSLPISLAAGAEGIIMVGGKQISAISQLKALGKFTAVSMAFDAAFQKLTGKRYISELLPEGTPQQVQIAIDGLELLGKIYATHGLDKVAPDIKNVLTRRTVEKYGLPQTYILSASEVQDVVIGKNQGMAKDILSKAGLTSAEWREAVQKGIKIDITADKVVEMVDRPYWKKIKGLFGIAESKPITKVTVGDKVITNIAGLLPSGEMTPQEAIQTVIDSPLEGTKLGKEILKTAVEAQQQGKNIKISGVGEGAAVPSEGAIKAPPIDIEKLKSLEFPEFSLAEIEKVFRETPADYAERWDAATLKAEEFAKPLQDRIKTVETELEKIKSDRKKEAVARKKELRAGIEQLKQKIKDAQAQAEWVAIEFSSKLAVSAMEQAKKAEIDLGEIGDGLEGISEEWGEFRDDFLTRLTERPYIETNWQTPVEEILAEMIEEYGGKVPVKPSPKMKEKYLYHGTSPENYEKILKEGFAPPEKSTDLPIKSWFTDNPEMAKNYGEKIVKIPFDESKFADFMEFNTFVKDNIGKIPDNKMLEEFAKLHPGKLGLIDKSDTTGETLAFPFPKVKPDDFVKTSPPQAGGEIPKELESLAVEARKYESSKDFADSIKPQKKLFDTISEINKHGIATLEDFYNLAIKAEIVEKLGGRLNLVPKAVSDWADKYNVDLGKIINKPEEEKIRELILKDLPFKAEGEKLDKAVSAYISDQAVYTLPDGTVRLTPARIELTEIAKTPEAQRITKERVKKAIDSGEIKLDKDGTITVYRVGTVPQEPKMISVSLDRVSAEQFMSQASITGKERPITELKIKPENIKVLVGGTENEALVQIIPQEIKVPAATPEEIKAKVTKLESQLKEKLLEKQQAVEEALSQVWMELDVAEAGQRIRVEDPESSEPTIIGIKSTFPKWVPEELRQRELFNKVMAELVTVLDNPKYPATPKLRELYDAILSEVDDRAGIDTSTIRADIMKAYELPKPSTEAIKAREGQKPIRGGLEREERAIGETKQAEPTKAVLAPKGYADKGEYAKLENLSLRPDKIKVVEFPELVRIARELSGGVPLVGNLRGEARGRFSPGTKTVRLDREIFKDPETAAKVLGHEIGHLADFLPEGTLGRGNLVGRIASLNYYLKFIYGDLKNPVIRNELKDLTQIWKPFDESESKDYTAYRYSSKELYADAISVLFNDPERLKLTAPNFWKGFFDYLDQKPEVKKNFFETWDLLNKGEEEIFKARDEELSKTYQKAEETYVVKELEKQKRRSSIWYQVKLLFDTKDQPSIEKMNKLRKEGKAIPPELNLEYALAGHRYSEGKLANWVNDNIQPIFAKSQEVPDGWNQLGKILFYERVINERGELANPQGYNPATAAKQLEMMEKLFNAEDWTKLQEAKEKFRAAVQKVVDLAAKNEYYTPELLKQMKMNPAYATYQVIDYLDTYISPRAYQSVGTLKDIANPATATVMKLMSVHKAIERNNIKKLHIKFYKQYFPQDIEAAKTRWNGRNMEIMGTRDPGEGLVILIEGGKPQGYYIDRDVAEMLNYTPNSTIKAAARIARTLSISRFYRPTFTTFNPGFQTFNIRRDFMRYWKNVPDYTLGQALTSLPRAMVRYAQATPSTIKYARGIKNQLIREMQEAKIVGLKYNTFYNYELDPDTTQMERILQKMGLLDRKKRWYDPGVKLLEAVGSIGDFLEALPKVAGYIELKGQGKMSQEEMAHFIRTCVGSPDFRTYGTFTPISNSVFLFSNAIKEGLKTDALVLRGKSAGGKYSQAGHFWKTLVANLLPKAIMAAIAVGYFGEKLKEIMDKATEYDKTNYTIVPVGLDENGKAIYFRMPQDETGRLSGGIFWKALNLNKGEKSTDRLLRDLQDIFAFTSGQLPMLSPSFEGIGAIVTYLSGKNPYDSFRGRYIIPDTEFKAGPKESFPILLKWLANQQGAGIILPQYKLEENATGLQKLLNLPVISNILGRWLKVSDYGETERLEKISQQEEAQRAQESLNRRRAVDKAIKEYQATNKTLDDRKGIENKLVSEVIGQVKNSQDKTARTNLIKTFRIGIIKGTADPLTSALIYATSNDEKVLLLREAKDKYGTGYADFERQMLKEKIISKDVIRKLRNP